MSRTSSRASTPLRSSTPTTLQAAPVSKCPVSVFVRIRGGAPPTTEAAVTLRPGSLSDPTTDRAKTCEVYAQGRGRFPFTFDDCFGAGCTQETVFEAVGLPLLANLIDGYNASIISYGATGSGKTFTMFGDGEEQRGLVPRICESLFTHMEAFRSTTNGSQINATVTVAMTEVYLEDAFDLLQQRKPLKVASSGPGGFATVNGKRVQVESYADVVDLLKRAHSQRKFSATAVHERSSRAHTIFDIELRVEQTKRGSTQTSVRCSKMALVDLAGSERIKVAKTDSGVALDEATNINLSLLSLGSCIEAVVKRSGTQSEANIGEFRNCTLTKLLKDYIGGHNLCTMIATVAPTPSDADQSLQTLRFVDRAKQIRTKPRRNSITGAGEKIEAAFSESMREELTRRKELVVLECQLQHRLQLEHSRVLASEQQYAALQQEKDLAQQSGLNTNHLMLTLDGLLLELEDLTAARDETEVALQQVRLELYPREYALQDEVRYLRAALSSLEEKHRTEEALLISQFQDQTRSACEEVASRVQRAADKELMERQDQYSRKADRDMNALRQEHSNELQSVTQQLNVAQESIDILTDELNAQTNRCAELLERLQRSEQAASVAVPPPEVTVETSTTTLYDGAPQVYDLVSRGLGLIDGCEDAVDHHFKRKSNMLLAVVNQQWEDVLHRTTARLQRDYELRMQTEIRLVQQESDAHLRQVVDQCQVARNALAKIDLNRASVNH